MAIDALTVVALTDAGEAAVDTAAVAGNTYTVNIDTPTVLRLNNAGGGAVNVTLAEPAVSGERDAGSNVIAVAAGATVFVAGLDPNKYGDTLDITVNGAINIAALQLSLAEHKPLV